MTTDRSGLPASVIQRSWRGYRCRALVKTVVAIDKLPRVFGFEADCHGPPAHSAARTIQCAWRAFSWRIWNLLQDEWWAAETIQRFWRRSAESGYTADEWRDWWAASTIQHAWWRYRSQCLHAGGCVREWCAAETIQDAWRRYRSRRYTRMCGCGRPAMGGPWPAGWESLGDLCPSCLPDLGEDSSEDEDPLWGEAHWHRYRGGHRSDDEPSHCSA